MKKKKSKSKRFKKVNGRLVEFRYPSFQDCMTECMRVSPPQENGTMCETICMPYRRPEYIVDEQCYSRCRQYESHRYCDTICAQPLDVYP